MQRGKRWPFAVLIAAGILAGCSRESAMTGLTQCTDPRPQACTRDYVPVCGALKAGGVKTYSNACDACADAAVLGHRPGACE
jgi:hypothetical protein